MGLLLLPMLVCARVPSFGRSSGLGAGLQRSFALKFGGLWRVYSGLVDFLSSFRWRGLESRA